MSVSIDCDTCHTTSSFHLHWDGTTLDGETHMFVCSRCLLSAIHTAHTDSRHESVTVDRDMLLPNDDQRLFRPKTSKNHVGERK